MAKTGLSKSFYALYDANNGNPTYSNGGTLGKAVDADIALDGNDAVIFYADNGPAESAAAFSGGTLTITNDRLSLPAVAAVLGLETTNISTPAAGVGLDFPADLSIPYVGYGTVFRDKVDNTDVYMGVVLLKVQFQIPVDSGVTQGETIAFEGHGFTAQILRDDATPSKWKKMASFATEANAEAWIKSILNIT